MSEELTMGPGTTVHVVARSDEVLEVEAKYAGLGAPPPAHLHPEQDEHFRVRSGAVGIHAGDRARVFAEGDKLEIPRGTAHRLWNDHEEPAVVRWRTMPAGRTLDWFRELAALQSGQHLKDPASLLSEYRDVFRLAEA